MGGRVKHERGQWVMLPVGATVYGHGEPRANGRGFTLRPFTDGVVKLGPPASPPALIVDVQEEAPPLPKLVFVRMSAGAVLALNARDVKTGESRT